jgi:two-component system sensor histidine kinase KdpD
MNTNRATATMALLLVVVAVAARGDWLLSVLTSASASLAFSWYFIDSIGSLSITTVQGAVTFSAMAVTALTVSRFSVRARRRADEAVRRRQEMEKLQQLGGSLLTAGTVADASEKACAGIVDLFGVAGAAIRFPATGAEYRHGNVQGDASVFDLGEGSSLTLYGFQPSAEVSVAVGQIVGLVLDRTRALEQKTRDEATRRSDELRATILDALAHNLKTPLTSIKAAASVLRGSHAVPREQARELIAAIDEEADRLTRLIEDSLELARLEALPARMRVEPCAVADIVDNVTSRLVRYLGNRELRVCIPRDLPAIVGDRFLFEQMLNQVVDNAWKYSKPGARIGIEAAQQQNGILLTVRNEGSTISCLEKDRIFGRFYRGAVHSKVEGTGLGLAIAKAIAEAHGGSIWLDSEPEGPAFRFLLPVGGNGELNG